MSDFSEMYEAVQNSEALKIHYRLKTLTTNHYVVQRNFQELSAFLKITQAPENFAKLWVMNKKPELELAMMEVTRLLLNFTSASKTRAENTSRFIRRWYGKTDFFKLYNTEVKKRFVQNDLVGFIEDLRNFSQHDRLPFASARWQMNSDPETKGIIPNQQFCLEKKDLVKASFKWKKGLRYLQNADEKIVIYELIYSYFDLINDFHVWTVKNLEDLHREDLHWLYETQKQINRLLLEAGIIKP